MSFPHLTYFWMNLDCFLNRKNMFLIKFGDVFVSILVQINIVVINRDKGWNITGFWCVSVGIKSITTDQLMIQYSWKCKE